MKEDLNKNSKRYKIIKYYGDGADTPGIYDSTFRIDIDTNELEITDILLTEKDTLLFIKDKSFKEGIYTYTLKLIDPNPNRFICVSEISVGNLVYKDLNVVRE